MITSSIGIFLAFWLLWLKLSWHTKLRALGHPFLLDLSASAAVWAMYGGTGEGMLAATFAAVIMSLNISSARYMFGYLGKKNGVSGYYLGKINMTDKLIKEARC